MKPPFGLAIPADSRKKYIRARIVMYVAVATISVSFLLGVFFPTFDFPFDFRNPGATRNTLFDPRSPEGETQVNGKLPAGRTLVADASTLGTFSQAEIRASLEKDSFVPESLRAEMRRSYRAFLLPEGEKVNDFPTADLYRVDDVFYELRGDTLFPFVSAGAFHSRFPEDRARVVSKEFLIDRKISPNWLGYRPGSLLSFADGVFVVTGDSEVRPIGSAEIFLGLGYRFEDVKPATEEEVGIYKRGRIFLMGAPHPDGTIFHDVDRDAYFIIDQGEKRPLLAGPYRDFLLSQTQAIPVSSRHSNKKAECVLSPGLFGQSVSCNMDIKDLAAGYGNDYELQILGSSSDIEFQSITLSLSSERSWNNIRRLVSQTKARFLARFGLGQP